MKTKSYLVLVLVLVLGILAQAQDATKFPADGFTAYLVSPKLLFRAKTIVHRTPTEQLLAADTNLLAQIGTNGIYGRDGLITNTEVRVRCLRYYHRQIDAANSDAQIIEITNRIYQARK